MRLTISRNKNIIEHDEIIIIPSNNILIELDEIDNSSLKYIFLDIGSIHNMFLESVCSKLITKLRIGGKISLSGINLSDVVRSTYQDKINDIAFNDIVYSCESIYYPSTIKSLFKSLKNTHYSSYNYTYSMEFTRE